VYTTKEILKLSEDELLDIISVKTTDDIRIFFDQIVSIDPSQVVLSNAENISIFTYERYEELVALFARYKMFKIMHDPKEVFGELQKETNILKNDFETRLLKLEDTMASQIELFSTTLDNKIDRMEKNILINISPAIDKLNNTSDEILKELSQSLVKVQSKIESIDTQSLNSTLDRLKNISSLLGEVVL
jgi:uncharacterized coiled-coil protein SlyX